MLLLARHESLLGTVHNIHTRFKLNRAAATTILHAENVRDAMDK